MWREDDAVYRWQARLDRIEEKPPGWAFDHAHGLEREQKREHFRVRFDETIDIELVPAPADDNFEGVDAVPSVARLRGRVTSLSGGGVAVEVNQALPRQVCLRMTLPLRRIGEARAEARVVGSTLLNGGRMAVRAEFVHLEEGAEDRIAKYVLERQHFQIARPAANLAG
jgi:c-di-GMP-binding flagellar brake protein YcgR